jgi:hypothetical protein
MLRLVLDKGFVISRSAVRTRASAPFNTKQHKKNSRDRATFPKRRFVFLGNWRMLRRQMMPERTSR